MKIDINCDVGEGVGNEAELMPFISSCNISCGAHAGTEEDILMAIHLASKYDVKIGAHPSYPDKENFGRVVLKMSHKELLDSLKTQLSSFNDKVKEIGAKIHHVKPHGALYNLCVNDEDISKTVLIAVEEVLDKVKIYAPYSSVIAKLAIERGFEVVYEAFADRNYNDDLSLVSRKLPNAVITELDEVLNHVQLMTTGKVKTILGESKPIKASTFCVHGDTSNAIDIVKGIHSEFDIA